MSNFKNNLCNIVVFNKEGNKILFSEADGKYCLANGSIQSGEKPYSAAYRHLTNYGGITVNDIELKEFMELRYCYENTNVICFVGKLNKDIPEIEECEFLKWIDADSDFSSDIYIGNGNVDVMVREIKANSEYCFAKSTEWISYDGKEKHYTTYSLVDSHNKSSKNTILMLRSDDEELIKSIFKLYSEESVFRIKYTDFIKAANIRRPKTTNDKIYKIALDDADNLIIEDFSKNDIESNHKTLKKYLAKHWDDENFRLIITGITQDDIKAMCAENVGGYYKIFTPVNKNKG